MFDQLAKAQREAKLELDGTIKKLVSVSQENDKLKAKIEKLSTRPTHMELLADFEANFDRALLRSVPVGQSVGQDTAQPEGNGPSLSPRKERSIFDPDGAAPLVDNMLMQELSEYKTRIDKLERLNSTLVHRNAQIETELKVSKRSIDELFSKLSRMELEKRMADMEAEAATKQSQEKSALLLEMQMEIDMVTKSAQKSAVKAAAGEEMLKTVKSDKEHIQQLEAKAQALQEWALASNHAKSLAQDRVRLLEKQVKQLQHGGDAIDDKPSRETVQERTLSQTKGSLVIGAGDVGVRVFSLDVDLLKNVNQFTERVVLRWTFDLTSEAADIVFSILKGDCAASNDRKRADAIIKDRRVVGGGGGETDNAFSIGRACTLVWSNAHSWVRPRIVQFTLQAVVVAE